MDKNSAAAVMALEVKGIDSYLGLNLAGGEVIGHFDSSFRLAVLWSSNTLGVDRMEKLAIPMLRRVFYMLGIEYKMHTATYQRQDKRDGKYKQFMPRVFCIDPADKLARKVANEALTALIERGSFGAREAYELVVRARKMMDSLGMEYRQRVVRDNHATYQRHWHLVAA